MESYKTKTHKKRARKTSRKTAKTFEGLSYRQVQKQNRQNREKLSKAEQQALKKDGYRNVGWANVISLYRRLEDGLRKQQIEEMTLEELFLESDRIGNKYLTTEEQDNNRRLLAAETQQIEASIDRHFPDTNPEVISFNSTNNQRRRIIRKT